MLIRRVLSYHSYLIFNIKINFVLMSQLWINLKKKWKNRILQKIIKVMLFIMYSLQKYIGKRAEECYEKSSVLHNVIYIFRRKLIIAYKCSPDRNSEADVSCLLTRIFPHWNRNSFPARRLVHEVITFTTLSSLLFAVCHRHHHRHHHQ